LRIKGWLGRADQTTKIKGMFVHPGQIQEIIKKHPQIDKVRVIVSGNIGSEEMTVHCVLKDNDPTNLDTLNAAIVQSTRDITKLRAKVCFENSDSLPSDGKLIEDARTYV
jgi:phenylacetate-CoA ligase